MTNVFPPALATVALPLASVLIGGCQNHVADTGRVVHFLSGKVKADVSPGTYQVTVEASAQVGTSGACLPGKVTIRVPVNVAAPDVPSHPANTALFKQLDQARAP